jgi:hypothetical protein
MFKKQTYTVLAAVTIMLFSTSCNTYHSVNNATSIGQLSGNPFMKNVAKSVISNLSSYLIQNGMQKMMGKLNLGTSISSILTTAESIAGFKNMLSSKYNIAGSLIDSNFGSFNTLTYVVGFVAKNGSGFKF